MKVSNKIFNPLGRLISGDEGEAPYLSGPQLVDFFNTCGFDDIYGAGFPSRWMFAVEKVQQANGTTKLKNILENFVDPRRFRGNQELVQKIVEEINALIKYDGFILAPVGDFYKIANADGNIINPESATTIGHEFIEEQIKKCNDKIVLSDYNGAITNARTLTEAILIHIIETTEGTEIKNSGDLTDLWKQAKKALKIDFKKEDIPDPIFQILSGLDTSLNGLAGLSNNAGDRHANKFNTKRHHAKLAVNVAMTLSDFLIDVVNERQRQKEKA